MNESERTLSDLTIIPCPQSVKLLPRSRQSGRYQVSPVILPGVKTEDEAQLPQTVVRKARSSNCTLISRNSLFLQPSEGRSVHQAWTPAKSPVKFFRFHSRLIRGARPLRTSHRRPSAAEVRKWTNRLGGMLKHRMQKVSTPINIRSIVRTKPGSSLNTP